MNNEIKIEIKSSKDNDDILLIIKDNNEYMSLYQLNPNTSSDGILDIINDDLKKIITWN